MVSTTNGLRLDASQYHLSSHGKLGKVEKLFTNLLALVLAYSLFLLTAVTYIPLHISFTLREHYFAYILLLHHRAHIISHASLQLHHHVLNKTYVNYITTS